MMEKQEKAKMVKSIEESLIIIRQRALSFIDDLDYMSNEDEFNSIYINTIDSELNKIRDKFAILKYNSRKK